MQTHPDKPHRGTLVDETAEVLAAESYPGQQHVLKLKAPEIARRARPGAFVHLRCAPSRAMRRPMSIMRADPQAGTLDILFKAHGVGTAELAEREVGDHLQVLGPIGVPFRLEGYRPRPLLIGGGVGLPPMVYLAEHLRRVPGVKPLVVLGSEVPFPFTTRPSKILVGGVPAPVIAAMPLLEDWGIASRLASSQGYPGCFEGHVTALADEWLGALDAAARDEVEIFACGPTPMLRAVQQLAAKHRLPAQISLEEYMACAVGGCAGCVVRVQTPNGPAMKRVCVDGPVFEAASVEFG